MEPEYLTVEEIAERLRVKIDTVREWIRKKQLPAYKFGKSYRVRKSDYDEFVKNRRTT